MALERETPGGIVSETFVDHIAYDAKGQRVLIAYGNGIMTRRVYDPLTLRLVRLRTERYQKVSEFNYRPQVRRSKTSLTSMILRVTF